MRLFRCLSEYSYHLRRVNLDAEVEEMPKFIASIQQRLVQQGIFSEIPDQMIVNEYLPGEAIRPHIDSTTDWGDTVASLSLGSSSVMNFTPSGEIEPMASDGEKFHWNSEKNRVEAFIEPRSLLVLKKAARFEWKHGIEGVDEDVVKGVVHPRTRRVSITFRKFIGLNTS